MLRNILLPLVSLLSGLVCLYIDPRKDRARAWMVIAVLSASALATGIYGYKDDVITNRKDATADARAVAAQAREDATNATLNKTWQEVEYLIAIIQTGKDGSLAAAKPAEIGPTRVQQSLAAGVAINNQLRSQSTSSQRPEIQYFQKDVDQKLVAKAMEGAGFRFVPMSPVLKNDPTNSIWIGDPVSLQDLKLVALTLVRAGVQIHSIRGFSLSSPRHSSLLIQIGAYPEMDKEPVWTVDRIQNLSRIPPRDSGLGPVNLP